MRAKSFGLSWTGIALGCVLIASCLGGGGGSGGGGSGGRSYSSGLPADKKLEDLTEEEGMEACEGFASSISGAVTRDDQTRAECIGQAVGANLMQSDEGGAELDVAGCNDTLDSCMDSIEVDDSELDVDIDCSADDVQTSLAGCDATVSQFEACINAALSELRRVFDGLSCEALADPEALEASEGLDDMDPFDVAACDVVTERCPELDFGDSSDGGEFEGGDSMPSGPGGCTNTCAFANDTECDDGGSEAITNACDYGTDCGDCGPR